MSESVENQITKLIETHAKPLRDSKDVSLIVEKISQAKIVMLGESSHGTHEYYEWRRLISQELIKRHGFNFIAVEGDWPPSSALNRYIHSETKDRNAREALRNFKRWPTWMWANTELIKLTDWMKTYNQERPHEEKAGFYGVDVYSLFESIDEVIRQVKKIDLELAIEIKKRYECFNPFHKNETSYARSLFRAPEGCKSAVLSALKDLLNVRLSEMEKENALLFDAQQNARIVKNAENYYHTMVFGNEDSWNVRDRHMMETLNLLLKKYGPESKAIVWAHNTHIGDYRATNMVHADQINIGGLAREEWGADRVALIGFGTYQGDVVASHAWDGPTKVMKVPPGQPHSYESLFHEAAENLNLDSLFLWLKGELRDTALSETLGHRAIGVVYNPDQERFGNYVPTSLSNRYDGFIFIDETHALVPLNQPFTHDEFPETWPGGY